MSTLQIKLSRNDRLGGRVKEETGRKEKSGLIKCVSLLSIERSMEGLQVSTRVVEEKGESYGNRHSNDQC